MNSLGEGGTPGEKKRGGALGGPTSANEAEKKKKGKSINRKKNARKSEPLKKVLNSENRQFGGKVIEKAPKKEPKRKREKANPYPTGGQKRKRHGTKIEFTVRQHDHQSCSRGRRSLPGEKNPGNVGRLRNSHATRKTGTRRGGGGV